VGLALGALLLASQVSCATAGSGTAQAPAPATGSLGEVTVESGSDGTVVSLLGLSEPVFTAFQQDDPARIVVDLAQVEPGSAQPQVAVYDGTVEEVSVSGFENAAGQPSTRVELSLGAGASYDVVALEDRLEIRVAREGMEADTLAVATVEEEPSAEPMGEASLAAAADEAVLESPVAPMPAAPASALVAVEATARDGGALVMLRTDGAVGPHSHFVLDEPARLVVDLPGLVSRADAAQVAVDAGGVARVRIGQHDDKLRVVIDASADAASLAGAEVRAVEGGLAVALGGAALPAAQAAQPAAAAEAPTPAAAEAPTAAAAEAPAAAAEDAGLTRVYGVQFDSQAERDRVVILTDAPTEYALFRPDAGTLIVRLAGATIDPQAAIRIAPEEPGPVSLVTAFEQPEAGGPEVRVVIGRAAGLEPSVSREGAMLFLDFPRGGALAAVPPALSGLAGTPPVGTEAASGAPGKAVAQAQAQAAPAVPAALDPSSDPLDTLREGGLVAGKVYTGRRISLDFKDVDIDDVLRLIAEVSDLNIIAGDEVQGEVTIRLVDVPWDQALDVILLTKGLGFVRVGNVLRIAPSELLKTEEEARLQERRAKEKLEDLVVKLQPVNYASVKEVEKMVKRLLTPRGSVDIDERTNTIILKDIASVIDEATALIKAIDTQTPQVLIEAKIVEANLDFSKEIGSQWAFGTQPFNDGFAGSASGQRQDLTVGGANAVQLHNNGLLTAIPNFNNVGVANPITSIPTGLLNLGAFLLDQKFNVELRLEAAESQGEGKVISSPRVVTLDNRKASIEQGVSIPFQTFENGDAKLEFIDAVLKLEVTPHITADQSIIMKIEVERNAPDDSVQTPTGSPAIAKNEATTETLVKDGQTLVIGGIYTVEKSQRQSRVPYLHNVPVLGLAFKNDETRDIRKELLVFVTPRIVINPEVGS
jgi:type IV pilus assembly protein PilQ